MPAENAKKKAPNITSNIGLSLELELPVIKIEL